VQQNKYFTARLYGLMTFDFEGSPFAWQTELKIASVPVEWMGHIFDGKYIEGGPGEDVTDQVHGSVLKDGTWIDFLFYSRQIVRYGGTAVFYRVTLKNVPISKSSEFRRERRRSQIYRKNRIHRWTLGRW
jgi:hypothetical protein